MPGLSHLRDVYDKRGKDFLDGLLNKTVIVNEKMDGAFFGAQKDPNTSKFRFFKRNAEITYIDRVLSRYFEPAIRHFENLGADTIAQIPENYHFGMEWFTSPKAQTIAYDRLPKNGLILSYIHVLDDKGEMKETIQDKATLDKWADLLMIERPPIVFEGKLSPDQKEKIQEFIYTPFEELVDKFKTTSFTKYIVSVLNPELGTTFLRDTLDKDIEGLVFRFYDPANKSEDSVFLAKLVDPVFQANAKQKAQDRVQKKSDDYIWIIVIDLMNFIERYSLSELRDIKLSGDSYEQRYISLVNHIYLDFIAEFGEKYIDLDIQIPEFLQREDFNVNYNLIHNKKVTNLIESNPNYKEIYRVFLNMFRKKTIRVSSTFFTKPMRANLVSQIEKISNVLLGDAVYENYFPTFGEFVGEDLEPGYFETFAEVPEEERKSKRVNLIISDFQPFHPGHLKSAQKLFDMNGFPCLFVCIHDGSVNKTKPFKKETVKGYLDKVATHHPSFVTGHRMVPDGEVENLLRAIKPDFEPVIISGTKSRIKDLALQMELAKRRSRNLNFRNDVALIELPIAGVKDSIMNSLRSEDYQNFKAAAPGAIHSEFFNMNRDINELASPKLNESVEATFANEVPPLNMDDEFEQELAALRQSSPEDYKKIIAQIKRSIATHKSSGVLNNISTEIVNRGYLKTDADRFSQICAEVSHGHEPTLDKLYDYIEKSSGYDISGLKNSGKLDESDFPEIDPTIFSEILNFSITTKSGTTQGKGIGELISILFQDGVKKSGEGDIAAGEINIEVKGNGGRLVSSKQGGFTNGKFIIETKLAELAGLVNNNQKVSNFLDQCFAKDGLNAFNIRQKGFLNTWKPLFKIISEESALKPDDFFEWFSEIFSGGIWEKGCGHKANLRKGISDFFQNDTPTKIEYQNFIDFLAWHSLLYYAKVDDFKILMVVDKETSKIAYFKVDSGFEEFQKHLRCTGGPDWPDPQNHNRFSIVIK
jgi:hypothetical protein